jgi:5'-3' exonuclease
MGIPFYFASLIKSHRGITRTVKQRQDVDVLGVDFNCLIHRYLKEDNPVGSVVDAFAHIMDKVCRPKHVLIAMDGIVPYAKIVQQRYRRMRIKTEDDKGFDRNQISPGTPYMKELEEALRQRFPLAQISSTLEEGEGEHKLFHMIRKLPESERKNVCIYGLDADLILICLQHASVSQQMGLLRESGEFNDPKLASAEFSVLSIQALQEQIPLPIPQYSALMILCFGNDFMPNLGMFSLREGGYERALEIYENAGNPDLLTFEGRDAFLDTAEKVETRVLKERISLRKRPEEKALMGRDGSAFERQYRLHILDGVQSTQKVVDAFWKTFHWTLHYFFRYILYFFFHH